MCLRAARLRRKPRNRPAESSSLDYARRSRRSSRGSRRCCRGRSGNRASSTSAGVGSTVPVCAVCIAETLCDGYPFPAFGDYLVEIVAREVCNGLFYNVMLNAEVVCYAFDLQSLRDNVFGVLDFGRERVEVVFAVEVEVNPVVPK